MMGSLGPSTSASNNDFQEIDNLKQKLKLIEDELRETHSSLDKKEQEIISLRVNMRHFCGISLTV